MKKRKFSIFKFLWLAVIISAIVFFGIRYYNDSKAFKIIITEDEINVREEHTVHSNNLGKVKKNQKFNVEEIYLDDTRYVWYKIEFEKGKLGWISSGRKNPYVEEINNPEGEGHKDLKVDYAKPIIKFTNDEVEFNDIDSINYDHLTIEDESEYTITHEIYYEEHPTDRPDPQYWIRYTVTDEFDNVSSKTQRIIFTEPPDPSTVKDFSEMK